MIYRATNFNDLVNKFFNDTPTYQYYKKTALKDTDNENYEIVGITTYAHGTMTSRMIDPSEYTLEVLEQFAIDNTWFSYNDYAEYVEEGGAEEEHIKKDQIIVESRQYSYAELIE